MIAKRTSSAPAGAKNFYAPIARFGFAVAAKALRKKGKDTPFLLGAAGTALAVEAISRTRGSFEAAVDKKLAHAGWSVDEPSRSELAGFAVDNRLGAVVNFGERKIARKGSVYVMRYCVTVCKEDRPDGEGQDENEAARLVVPRGRNALAAPQHSKIWVRFLCISYRSKAAIDLTPREMRAFFDEAKELSGRIRSAVIDPYKAALAEVVSRDPDFKDVGISLRTVFNIHSFTVSLLDDDFAEEYRQVVIGEDLSAISDKSPARISLDVLRRAFDTKGEEILPVEDLGFARGIYWFDLQNDHATLVGVANNSLDDDRDETTARSEVGMLKLAPSNIIGILSGTMLASAI